MVVVDGAAGNNEYIFIPIAACLVGRCFIDVDEGSEVEKGAEIGHFAFAGSTICILLRNDRVHWDDDLLKYTQQNTEVTILQSQRVGRLTHT